MHRPLSVAAAAALFVFSVSALARLTATPGGRVSFSAVGPAGMKIVGTTSELAASDDGQNVTVTVTLTHLATGIDLRDKHMREKYLETPTYPTAALTVPRAALSFPAPGTSQSGDPTGTVTLHGRTRPTTFHYVARRDDGTYQVDATLRVDMRDYGITVPSYLGVSVKPDVDIDVHFSAVDQ